MGGVSHVPMCAHKLNWKLREERETRDKEFMSVGACASGLG